MDHLKEAVSLASRAVEFDKSGCIDAAAYFYREAARSLNLACLEFSEVEKDKWSLKARQYNDRADFIQSPKRDEQETQDPCAIRLHKCKFLFSQALDADEAGQKDTAIKLYTEAVELGLTAKKDTEDKEQQRKLMEITIKALERAEELKGIKLEPIKESDVSTQNTGRATTSTQATSQRPSLHRGSSAHLKVSGMTTYTEAEKKVLLNTSRINNIDYVPFMSVDLSERFQYAIPFTDKSGQLALSPSQKRHFSHWARPQEFCSDPRLIQGKQADCFSIKQTTVSDCSFVASLAVSALYEKKFKQRLITSIIYPRNSSKEPVYNPFGKYMVKLHLNGVPRKVIIDDYLPVSKHGELLCSFSTNKNELWVALLEKAYMKVMGGYDFPGSNSNIDLHALTGWIPERIPIRAAEHDFNSDTVFETLFTRIHSGHVLVTVATWEMSDSEAERAGLVPTHAYAVLDIRRINGHKLLQLKNPWSHVRWKGKFSELDTKNWTPELQKALNFDPSSAAMFDNGVFWIDYNSILHYFDIFYLNWDPGLFKYTYCIHKSWSAGVGPVKDSYNIGDNPQFRLNVSQSSGSVWILLTRHITDLEDFKQNREYITVLVYKNNGKRVYYPNDPPPYLDGVRINSPHYLTKIVMKNSVERNYTLVMSQYEKMKTIFYTLRVYATCPIELEEIVDPYKFVEEVRGKWNGESAGGCPNHPSTYPNNPAYKVVLPTKSSLLIDLKGPKQYQVGFKISPLEGSEFASQSTGAYRSGFSILEIEDIPEGSYKVVPTTFYPNQESDFFLTFKSSSKIQVTCIK